MAKRTSPTALSKVLEYDVAITKSLTGFILRFNAFKTIKFYGKFLEYSCNGIVWIAMWLAFIWTFSNSQLYEMQLNMLVGLLLDIIVIAFLKAFTRRRRPIANNDMFTIGPDKFSFPSGHASRSFYILMFYTYLQPVTFIFWPPIIAWACVVCISRLVMQRHFILDITAGIVIGVLEAFFLGLIWIGPKAAISIIDYLSNDVTSVEME